VKLSLARVCVGIVLVVVLLFLYFKTNQIVFAEHVRFDERLDRLRQLDAMLNQDVLKARFRTLEDAEGFQEQIHEQKQIAGNLATPLFIPETGRHLIREKVTELSALLAQRAELLERFESENAVLNKSLTSLPATGTELIKRAAPDDRGRELQTLLNELMRQALVYSQQANEEQPPEIQLTLDKLDKWRSRRRDEAQDAALASLTGHVICIVQGTPKLDALTKQLLSIPIRARTEGLQAAYDDQFAKAMHSAKLYRVALCVFCALLVLGIGYTIFALDAANARLEDRVRERTGDLRRKKEELEASEERFCDAFEHAPIGMALASPEGRWLKVNPALCEAVGYSEAELLSRTFQDITPPEDMEISLENVRRLMAGEMRSSQMEKRYVHACGRLVTVLLSVSLVRDDQGQPRYFIAQIQDITGRKLAEEEMQWKTSFLEAHVNSSIDGILIVDQKGKKILQNPRVADLFKIPRHIADDQDDGKQLRWVTAMTKDPDQFVEKVIHLYAHPDEASRDEIMLQDGRTLDRYSSPVFGKDGQYYGRIWTFRDITEQRLRENALRESDEKFHQLADNVTDGFWITSPDLSAIHYVSPGYELIWRRSAQSLRADPRQRVEAILPEERERVFAAFAGLAGNDAEVSVEYRITHPDGAIRWIQDRGFQVRDAAGAVVRLTGIARDITERKRTDEIIQRLAAIVENSDEAIISKTLNGIITSWNPAAATMFGYTATEIIGQPLEVLIPPDRPDEELEILRGFGQGELVRRFESVRVRKDGRRFDISATISPIKDSEGKVIGASKIVRDITERKRTEEELSQSRETLRGLNAELEQRVAQRTEALLAATHEAERANAAKNEFLSRMSHELRTPLNAIIGFGQLLEQDGRHPEEADNIAQILKAGRHLLKLVDEVLAISDIEAGILELERKSCPVGEVIEEALALARPLAAERQVALRNVVCDRWVSIDRQRFEQVVFNLLSNAISDQRAGGSVTLAAQDTTEGWLRLAITVDAPGIAAADGSKVFQTVARPCVVSKVEGLGLGLAISERLVALMGCRMGVESALGKGSTFWIEAPPAETSAARLDGSAPRSIRHARTLLYVEDDLSHLRLISLILARRPAIRLLSAATGALGLKMAREHLPDLIVLDPSRADSHGVQALAALRADPRTSQISVVILCGDAPPAELARSLAGPACVFLTKPLDVRVLLRMLDQVLERRP